MVEKMSRVTGTVLLLVSLMLFVLIIGLLSPKTDLVIAKGDALCEQMGKMTATTSNGDKRVYHMYICDKPLEGE